MLLGDNRLHKYKRIVSADPVLASEGSSRSFLRHFPVRYLNSDNTKRKLVEFYTKAMLRFLIFEEFLKKYCGWKFGGQLVPLPPPDPECYVLVL